jgi:hypothetical protein
METGKRYIWHHRLHEAWAGERLYFWRLAFFPTYDQERIAATLQEVLREHEVASSALYEIYGVYDMVLRIWLPTGASPETFENALDNKLTPLHMEVCDSFSVGQVLRHWPWLDDEEDELQAVRPGLLGQRYSPDTLQDLNEIAQGKQLASEQEEPLKTALEDKALAPCSMGGGIKFIVVVTSSSQLATIAARSALRNELTKILSEAEEVSGVSETSLYEGSGFGQFILLGRVEPERFSDLRSAIIDRVNAAGTGTFFRARPYTYIAAGGVGADSPAPAFIDQIPLEAETNGDPKPVEEYLQQDESNTLEVKGSSFVNVERWIRSGKAAADESVTDEGVLKAVVGMLNNEGGTMIIGALEAKRFENGGLEGTRLEQYPIVGKYLCIGVEIDYQGSDWDHYALKLQRVIMDRIDPPPVGLVTISKVSIAGKDLCILSVQATEREWFYLGRTKGSPAQFYVRLGNATLPLDGPHADAYKVSRRRG